MPSAGLWGSEAKVSRLVDEIRRLLEARGRTDVTVQVISFPHSPDKWSVGFECEEEDDDVVDEVFNEARALVVGPSPEGDEEDESW